MNNIIELKREYLNILIEELTPLVYEGLHEMYMVSSRASNDTTVLRNFQTILKDVCNWDSETKKKEVDRILNEKYKKIILSVFKAEIIILSNDYSNIPNTNIEFNEFIHMLYKECAKQLWPLPFLFYDKYCSIEINRNNYEIRKIIKLCIEHTFRRLIPLNDILKTFLGDISFSDIDFKKLLPPKQSIVMENKNIIENQNIQTGGNDDKILKIINENIKLSESPLKSPEIKNYKNNSSKSYSNKHNSSRDNSSRHNSSRDNLNKHNSSRDNSSRYNSSRHNSSRDNSSRDNSNKHNSSRDNSSRDNSNKHNSSRDNSSQRSTSTLKKIINESINHKYKDSTYKNSINSEIKNHLMKDLESETLTYNPETNIKNYHDIFSNSEVDNNTYHNSIKDTNKQKFINDYLTK